MSLLAITPSRIAAFALGIALSAALLPSPAMAAPIDNDNEYDQYDDSPASRVGRISRLDGEAAVRAAGSPDWQAVSANTPIFQGDEVFAGDRSRLEIQLGGGRYLRMDERTEIVFAGLDEDAVRIEMSSGSMIVSLRELDGRDRFQITAPAASVDLREDGVYRVDVDDLGATRVSVYHGRARVNGPERDAEVDEGESALFDYNDPSDVDFGYAAADSFDGWSRDLDERYDDAYASSRDHVGSLDYRSDIYGLAELVQFGSWVNSGQYGSCWVPRVGSGWSPYSNGYWQYYPNYGYTWISYDPWGWAPFHYGRWSYLNGYGWAWVPWSQFSYGNYYWTPSQVYWCQYPNYGGYAWVPLAPSEPYVPYIAYERFGKRHHRDFVPEHLRAGRGIGLTQPGSGARLKPVRDGGRVRDLTGRAPVEGGPSRPKDLAPIKPRVVPADTPRVKPRPVAGGDGRGPVVMEQDDRPVKSADKPVARPTTERPKPIREKRMDGGPTYTPKPKVDRPTPVERTEKPRVVDTPRQERPRSEPKAEPRQERPRAEPRQERPQPKPERTVDRAPKTERVERAQPAPKREKP